MKYQAHRGVGTEFPENTVPSFRAAVAQGYDYIELDPAFTKDGCCVVLHDATLNRTCRRCDGSSPEKPLNIADISYSEALSYDAGIAKAYKFRGTKIPLLTEALAVARNTGVTVKLDNRIQYFSAEQTETLFSAVENSGTAVAFTVSDTEYLKKVVSRFPDAEIHYDGHVSEEKLTAVRHLLRNNPLTVWLCLPSPATSWVKVPKADRDLCNTVKKYGSLGLWILENEEQLSLAEEYGADVIETPGQLKPVKRHGFVDCHTHTRFSHDSVCDPAESVRVAKEKELFGIAFTDHFDTEYEKNVDIVTPIRDSVNTAGTFRGYALSGIEIGEAVLHPDTANRIITSVSPDIVLCSVHAVRYKQYTMPYSQIDFSKFTEKEIGEYLAQYFDDLTEAAEASDCDVLSHLTCPLRYICGKYGISVDLHAYEEKTDRILKTIIQKGVALEVNTSGLGSDYDCLMPSAPIIKKYKEFGGTLITLASDAHKADRIAHGFPYAAKILREIGFGHIFYYKNRIPVAYAPEEWE